MYCDCMKMKTVKLIKLLYTNPQNVSNAAEACSLSLNFRYKLDLAEGKISAVEEKMSCLTSMREPADALPHHLESGTFVFKRGKEIYQYSCTKWNVKLLEKNML